MKYYNTLLLAVLTYTFSSCNNNAKLVERLKEMESIPINLNLDEMESWIPSSIDLKKTKNVELKYVIYSDSNQCSQCYINHLFQWNEMLELEKSTDGKLQFYFIIEPSLKDKNGLKNWISRCNLEHPVFIDYSSVFRKNNPFVPKEPLFHCFLLDETNKVILIGNPLHNEGVEKLLKKVIKDRSYNFQNN